MSTLKVLRVNLQEDMLGRRSCENTIKIIFKEIGNLDESAEDRNC